MALKTGLARCVQTALEFVQPLAFTSPLVSVSQRCHLWTSRMTPCISSNAVGFQSATTRVSNVSVEKKTCLIPPAININMIHVRQYHSVLRPRLHCRGCYFVWRHGRKFVECSDVPSHKQMKKLITRKLWKEDYTKGNVRKAMNWHRDMQRVSDRLCDKDTISHNWLASRIGKDV